MPEMNRPRWRVALIAVVVIALPLAGCMQQPEESTPETDDGAQANGADGEHDHNHNQSGNHSDDGSGNATPSNESGEGAAESADPVPEVAKGPEIPEQGYLVEEIDGGLYWMTDGTYQLMFLTTGEGVIVVDAPPSLAANVPGAVANVTDEPITHVIYSHSHADHIAGAHNYPENATYIAHEATVEQLVRERDVAPFGAFVGGEPVRTPTVTFTDNHTLTVGNQTLELSYKGPAHEPGNIFVYAPQQKVLMLVDVIFPGWSPFFRLAVSEDVPAWVAAHDQVLAYDFETFIGGHLTRLGTREDVERQQEYILDVRANAAEAIRTVDFQAIAADVGTENQWLLFKTYLDALSERCTELTLEKWRGELGGVDVATESHCAAMVESLRID